MAVSASRSMTSGDSAFTVLRAMPMLAVAKISWPQRSKGLARSWFTRSAMRAASEVRLHLLQEDGELVSPEARQHVARAQARLEAVGDGDEELVPDDVAQAVVHELEAVHVEQEEGEGVAAAADVGLVRGDPQALHELGAVGEAREAVV